MNHLVIELEKIIRWPKKPRDKDFVINWLAAKFTCDKNYTENEVNEILDRHHSFNDIALLRRKLVSKKYLMRKDDGFRY